jgi:hypothetical protein
MKTIKFIVWATLGSVFAVTIGTLVLFIRPLATANDTAGAAAMLAIWELSWLTVALLSAVAGFLLARMLKRRSTVT